jgi:hypothetical protein
MSERKTSHPDIDAFCTCCVFVSIELWLLYGALCMAQKGYDLGTEPLRIAVLGLCVGALMATACGFVRYGMRRRRNPFAFTCERMTCVAMIVVLVSYEQDVPPFPTVGDPDAAVILCWLLLSFALAMAAMVAVEARGRHEK